MSPRQFVTLGAGSATASAGSTISYLSPTDPITETGPGASIAGLTFEFLYAPDTEAPEEMHIWIPELQGADLRGERQPLACTTSRPCAGPAPAMPATSPATSTRPSNGGATQAEVHYGPHTWPVWGNENIVPFIEVQRDTYKYIHDQALRLANKGYTPLEAAEVIELPEELAPQVVQPRVPRHRCTTTCAACYTKELGMWDGDPVSLHPHTPVESAQTLRRPDRRREDHGRRQAGLRCGRLPVGRRDPAQAGLRPARQPGRPRTCRPTPTSRWATRPKHRNGAGSSSPPPANCARAHSSRRSPPPSPDTILAMPIDILFDFAAVHVIGDKAAEIDLRIDFTFTDLDQTWTVWVKRGVLNARVGASPDTQLTVSGPKAALVGAVLKPAAAQQAGQAGQIHARRRRDGAADLRRP